MGGSDPERDIMQAMSELSSRLKGFNTPDFCKVHEPMMQKLDSVLTGMSKLEAAVPVQLKDLADGVRELRTSMNDRTEKLFGLYGQVQEQITEIRTTIAVLKERDVSDELEGLKNDMVDLKAHKLPPRVVKLEGWKSWAVGGFAGVSWLIGILFGLWGVIKK